MNQLTCEVCGSTDLIKDSGVFVCQFCGCKYTIEEVRKLMVEGVVEVTGTVKVDNTEQIENILVNARRSYEDGRYKEAQALYQQVLAADPNNIEAILFEGISAGWQGNLVRYTMQQATDATLRALQIASNKTERPEELEAFVWKGLSEITELGNAVVSLCEKSTQESVKRGERELESVKRYSDQAGLYADFEWIKQRGDDAIATLQADEKKYGEIKDNTYLLVLSVYEEVLKIFKEAEKYELETFDKMIHKLKECKIDKNAYYKMTVNKYQNVLELIQKKIRAKEDYLRKIEEAKDEQYWEEHKEEKNKLENELNDLESESSNLKMEISRIEKSIKDFQKEKDQRIPLEDEMDILEAEKRKLIAQKSGLGLFKTSEKKVVAEKIAAKEKEIFQLKNMIEEEKNTIRVKYAKRIGELKTEKDGIASKIKEVDQRINVIKRELSMVDIEEAIEEKEIEVCTQNKINRIRENEALIMEWLEGGSILSKEEYDIMKNEWLQSGRITYEAFSKMTHMEAETFFLEILDTVYD